MFNSGLKRGQTRLLILALALAPAVTAFAADLSGKWSGSFTDSDSGKTSDIYAVLKQDGANLTGTAGPSETRQMSIASGKLDGDRLTFEVRMAGGTMSFDLTIAGSELKGKMQLSEDGRTATATVGLKRVP